MKTQFASAVQSRSDLQQNGFCIVQKSKCDGWQTRQWLWSR